eukprot:15201_1
MTTSWRTNSTYLTITRNNQSNTFQRSVSPDIPISRLQYDQINDQETEDYYEKTRNTNINSNEQKHMVERPLSLHEMKETDFDDSDSQLQFQQTTHIFGNTPISNNDTFEADIVIEKFKIAITFLLHPQSPLHNSDNCDEETDTSFDIIDKCLGNKNNVSLFKTRCHKYNNDTNAARNSKYYKVCLKYLHSFYTKEYQHQWSILNTFWNYWNQNINDNISEDTDCDDETTYQSYLEEACDIYLWNRETLNDMTNTTTLHKLISMSQRHINIQPLSKLKKNVSVKHGLGMTNEERRISQINNIDSVKSMQQWIDRYKDNVDHHFLKCGYKDNIHESHDKKPMYLWKWEDVVTFVEQIEEIKHFASVFWQYKIDGKELCSMNQKQIEYLIECSLMNNHKIEEKDLDLVRSNLEQQNQVWPISQEANALKQHIDKTRIKQHIICRYNLSINLLNYLSNEKN